MPKEKLVPEAAKRNSISEITRAQMVAQSHLDDRQAAKARISEAGKWILNTLLILNGGGLLICIDRIPEDPSLYGSAIMFVLGLGVLIGTAGCAMLHGQNSIEMATGRFRGQEPSSKLKREERKLVILMILSIAGSFLLFALGQGALQISFKAQLESQTSGKQP